MYKAPRGWRGESPDRRRPGYRPERRVRTDRSACAPRRRPCGGHRGSRRRGSSGASAGAGIDGTRPHRDRRWSMPSRTRRRRPLVPTPCRVPRRARGAAGLGHDRGAGPPFGGAIDVERRFGRAGTRVLARALKYRSAMVPLAVGSAFGPVSDRKPHAVPMTPDGAHRGRWRTTLDDGNLRRGWRARRRASRSDVTSRGAVLGLARSSSEGRAIRAVRSSGRGS